MIAPEKLESDIHLQVYFYARPYKNGYDSFEALQILLTQIQIHFIV